MPILVFLIIASAGFYTTRILFGVMKKYEGYTRQIGALTIAFGFSITWFFSIISPIAVAYNLKIEYYLLIFIFATSVGVWILSYITALFMLAYFEKNQR